MQTKLALSLVYLPILAKIQSLPQDYEVIIIGKVLPGDDSQEWASPYAGACWVGVHDSTPYEQGVQLEGFTDLWKLAAVHPESSARRTTMTEIMDHGTKEQVWYAHKVPGFRFLAQGELPQGALYGMTYQTIVLNPHRFVVWMREHFEAKGVAFKRAVVRSLGELEGLGHDVLINATGQGARDLSDIRDADVVPARMQVILADVPDYDALYIHRGLNGYYSTAFVRGDGTVWVGGVLSYGKADRTVYADQRKLLAERARQEQPQVFTSPNLEDWGAIQDHVGIYAVVNNGTEHPKVREEFVGRQKVIHAYVPVFGAYVCGYGVGRDVATRIGDHVHQMPVSARL
ncbi:hypothetical protein BKA66DRAFT_517461 [Pyrenochaeta sp. MPI-SDFR-AT-0127]|nr:hypothetical protein BKA66DRAFT_517461 [Pyrenochaeta sp. MPI-SDFR-AT-0127]